MVGGELGKWDVVNCNDFTDGLLFISQRGSNNLYLHGRMYVHTCTYVRDLVLVRRQT